MYSTPRVTGFEVAGPHTLVVTFSDSSEQRIDFRPALIGDRFGPLQDIDAFKAVAIDPFGALVWPADTPQRNCLSSFRPQRLYRRHPRASTCGHVGRHQRDEHEYRGCER